MTPETTKDLLFDSTGLDTNSTYRGKFVFKLALSPRDLLLADQIERDNLGGVSWAEAGSYAKYVAHMISQLAVRIKEGPSWWKESNNGKDLQDFNILEEVFVLIAKEVNTYTEQRAARAEKLKKPIEEAIKAG